MPDQSPISRTLEIEVEEGAAQGDAASYLYVALDCSRPVSGGARFAISGLDEIAIGRGRRRALEPHPEGGERRRLLTLADRAVSSMHARVLRDGDGYCLEDLGSTNGSRVDGAVVKRRAPLAARATIEIGGTFLVFQQRGPAADRDHDVSGTDPLPLGLATLLPDYEAALGRLAALAPTSVPVMLLGETGTGKELLARALHQLSGRRGAFVPVNCGALPEALVEGLLFGHVRGSFSGATKDEIGLVRASHGGTLFLDEIGELPKPSQAKLLRVLQQKEVLPVGSTQPIPVDLRVVSATHQVVERREDSSLRADLHARLSGFVLRIPPLRERLPDLGLVIAGIASQLDPPARDLTLTPALGRCLMSHPWPFNARELYQMLSVAVVLASGQPVDVTHLPETFRLPPARSSETGPPRERTSSVVPAPTEATPLDAAALDDGGRELRERLTRCLVAASGNVSEVSRVMGRSRMQIHRWMQRFGLDPETFRR